MPSPAAPTVHDAVMAKLLFWPAHTIVTPVTCEPAEPELVSVMYGTAGADVTQVIVPDVPVPNPAAVSVVPVTEIVAAWDDVPKMPKTKPPIATAAISVTAMISTVAMIGEMALLEYDR